MAPFFMPSQNQTESAFIVITMLNRKAPQFVYNVDFQPVTGAVRAAKPDAANPDICQSVRLLEQTAF